MVCADISNLVIDILPVISAPGVRFPRAVRKPPRRKLLRGLPWTRLSRWSLIPFAPIALLIIIRNYTSLNKVVFADISNLVIDILPVISAPRVRFHQASMIQSIRKEPLNIDFDK